MLLLAKAGRSVFMDKAMNEVLTARPSGEEPLRSSPGASLQQIDRICRGFHIDSLLPQLTACAEVLKDGDIVDVAVVGRFKAGKSSFLNSILDRNLVPVGAVPLTAVVTRLRFGPNDRAVVKHLDEREEEIPLERLAEYVTEQRNPGNEKGVAIVDVETPSLRLYQGIRFVDTPGLGSVFAHNTRTAVDWLPRVGAALLAVSIDQPLSEYDVSLLKELAKHAPEVSILLTKADLVSAQELAEVGRFIAEQLGALTDGAVRVFPFSVRAGYEPLRDTVQQHLATHVSQRHEERSQEIIRHKLRSLIAGCRDYLRMALSAASGAAEAREQLQRQLEQERQSLSTVRNEIWVLSMDLKGRVQADALDRYLGHSASLVVRLTAELRLVMPEWKGHLRKTAERFAQWASDALYAELGPLSHQEGDELTARHLAAAQESLTRTVRGFQDRLSKDIERALHMTFRGAGFEGEIRHPERPDVRLSRVFDIPFEILWFVIPMWIFRPLVNRHFLRRIPWEVDKNLHRLAAQWSQAIGDSIDGLAHQAQEFMRQELATIEGLVTTAQDQRPAIEAALAALEDLEQRLEVTRRGMSR
jgi:GTP-binding protein EngB required for normal cell division